MNKKYTSLSKKMSLALRHDPGKFGIELDGEGWTALPEFLKAMAMTVEDLNFIQANNSKKRFEVKWPTWSFGGKIRAFYGHSQVKVEKEIADPPEILYHGTPRRFLDKILKEGLKPMSRQYVHHSTDLATAQNVGGRRDVEPVVLIVKTKAAKEAGVRFYHGNEDVWLSDPVPPEFLKVKSGG